MRGRSLSLGGRTGWDILEVEGVDCIGMEEEEEGPGCTGIGGEEGRGKEGGLSVRPVLVGRTFRA